MPKMATTIVASKAARSEIDNGFQTQGGMSSVFSHERGTSPIMLTRFSPVPPAQARGQEVAQRSACRSPARC